MQYMLNARLETVPVITELRFIVEKEFDKQIVEELPHKKLRYEVTAEVNSHLLPLVKQGDELELIEFVNEMDFAYFESLTGIQPTQLPLPQNNSTKPPAITCHHNAVDVDFRVGGARSLAIDTSSLCYRLTTPEQVEAAMRFPHRCAVFSIPWTSRLIRLVQFESHNHEMKFVSDTGVLPEEFPKDDSDFVKKHELQRCGTWAQNSLDVWYRERYKNAENGVALAKAELYKNYVDLCESRDMTPVESKQFHKTMAYLAKASFVHPPDTVIYTDSVNYQLYPAACSELEQYLPHFWY